MMMETMSPPPPPPPVMKPLGSDDKSTILPPPPPAPPLAAPTVLKESSMPPPPPVMTSSPPPVSEVTAPMTTFSSVQNSMTTTSPPPRPPSLSHSKPSPLEAVDGPTKDVNSETKLVPTVATPTTTPNPATTTDAAAADDLNVEKGTPIEEASKVISALPDPLTIFLGELVFMLLLNVLYPPILHTWIFRLVLPVFLLATAAIALLWRRLYQAPDANILVLNEEERKNVAAFQEKVRLREVDLKAKEAKLKQEEEKLRAVRAQLLSKIANTDLDPSLQERATRGVLLSPRNAAETPGAIDVGNESLLSPRAVTSKMIAFDKEMRNINGYACESFQERTNILAQRALLGLDSNAEEMSAVELRQKAAMESNGILVGFLKEIFSKPDEAPPKRVRPSRKLLQSRGLTSPTQTTSAPPGE